MRAAAFTVSPIRAGSSTGKVMTPESSSTPAVDCPIGTCQGLNSPYCPRMVTRISSGKRQVRASDSMLMQLPTPLDCISSAARSPPSQAPAASATPSSSVVSDTACMFTSSRQRSISREWPASGT